MEAGKVESFTSRYYAWVRRAFKGEAVRLGIVSVQFACPI